MIVCPGGIGPSNFNTSRLVIAGFLIIVIVDYCSSSTNEYGDGDGSSNNTT